MDEKIIGITAQFVMFDMSVNGKKLDKLKCKEQKANKPLQLLGVMKKNPVANKSRAWSYQNKLDEFLDFIEYEDYNEDDLQDLGDDSDDGHEVEGGGEVPAAASAVDHA